MVSPSEICSCGHRRHRHKRIGWNKPHNGCCKVISKDITNTPCECKEFIFSKYKPKDKLTKRRSLKRYHIELYRLQKKWHYKLHPQKSSKEKRAEHRLQRRKENATEKTIKFFENGSANRRYLRMLQVMNKK